MPLENVLFLCLVAAAFTVFAISLAYADWATCQAMHETKPSASTSAKPDRAVSHQHKDRIVYRTAA